MFLITVRGGVLHAELVDRKTAGETREFLDALVAAARKREATRVLISVRASRPIFKVEQYGASAYLKQIAASPETRVALVAGDADVRSAHEYVELLARQQGANLRSFGSEAAALAWLADQSQEKR